MAPIDYEHEIDELLVDGSYTLRSLARELLELRLDKLPRLQEEVQALKVERRNLLSSVEVLEQHDACVPLFLDGEEDSAETTDPESEAETEGSTVTERSEPFRPPLRHNGPTDGLVAVGFPACRPLPIDILRIIFENLLPDMDAVELSVPSVSEGPWCQSLRTKKSLARVCKTWHYVTLGFLYRDVVLRSVSQIVNFARTVSEDPLTFGSRVRRLVFACLLPNGVSNGVQKSVSAVLENCTGISRVSFGGFEEMGPKFGGEVMLWASSSVVPDLGEGQVHADGTASPSWLLCIPHAAFKHLRSLEVALWSEQANVYANAIQLPVLDTLILRRSWLFDHEHDVTYHYPVTWNMPSLKHLRFRCSVQGLPTTPSCFQFFDKYGPSLLSLGFGPVNHRIESGNRTMVTLVERCPSLTHLAFEPVLDEELPYYPPSQVVRRIDMFLPNDATLQLAKEAARKASLTGPGWTNVRFFEQSLIAVLPDLPFCPLLPRSWAEFDAMTLGKHLDICGYQVSVNTRRRRRVEAPELLFYEAEWHWTPPSATGEQSHNEGFTYLNSV